MMVKIYAIEIIFRSHEPFQSYQLTGPVVSYDWEIQWVSVSNESKFNGSFQRQNTKLCWVQFEAWIWLNIKLLQLWGDFVILIFNFHPYPLTNCMQSSKLSWNGIFLPKSFWPTVRKTFEIRGWRPRICKIFEITRMIYSNSERS